MGSASQNRFATLLICATKADQNLWKITGVSLFTAAGPHPRGYSRLRFARRWSATTAFFRAPRWPTSRSSRPRFARRWSATTAFFQGDSLAHVPILATSLRSPLVSDDSLLSGRLVGPRPDPRGFASLAAGQRRFFTWDHLLLRRLTLARVHRFREDLALVDAVERLPQVGP